MEDSEAAQEIEALRAIWPELQDRPHVWNSPAVAIPVCRLGTYTRILESKSIISKAVHNGSSASSVVPEFIADACLGQRVCVLQRVSWSHVCRGTRRVGLEKQRRVAILVPNLETAVIAAFGAIVAMLQTAANCRICWCSGCWLLLSYLAYLGKLRTDLLGHVHTGTCTYIIKN